MRVLAAAALLVGWGVGSRASAQCLSSGTIEVLTDAAGFEWDVQYDGNIEHGTVDAYDNGLLLEVAGVLFTPVDPGAESTELDGRQLVVGPQNLAGLGVTRRVYVPTTAAWARFIDTFENTTTVPIGVAVRSVSNLGSDDTTEYFATSSGDTTFDTSDQWVASDDGPADEDPTMVHVFWGMGAAVTPSAVSTTVYDCGSTHGLSVTFDLVVPPGARVSLMYFASQNGDRTDAMASVATLEDLGGPTLAGLGLMDVTEIVNWSIDCAMRAEECNGADDNCDATVDEGFAVGGGCSAGIGACEDTGVMVCAPDGTGVVCDASPGAPQPETCDGVDEDCDGVPDPMETVCRDAGTTPDAGSLPDAGPRPDGGALDSGTRPDAGGTLDVHGSGVLCSAGAARSGGGLRPHALAALALVPVAACGRRLRRRGGRAA